MKNCSWIRLGVVLIIAVLMNVSSYGYIEVKCFMPQVPEVDLQGVKRIAILDFTPSNSASGEAGRAMADNMIEFLLQEDRGIRDIEGGLFASDVEGVSFIKGASTKLFEVVERSRLEAVMSEQMLGEGGLVDEAQAQKLGEILGVEVVIYGDVSDQREDTRARETHVTTRNKQRIEYIANCITRKVTVTANIRMVETKTGKILATKRESITLTDKVCDDQSKELRGDGEMAGQAVRVLARYFVNQFNPWYALEEFELEKIKLKEFKDKGKDAAKAAEDHELAKAYAIYNELYQSDMYNPKFLYNMGVLYEITGDFEKAKEMYDGAAMLDPDDKYQEASKRIATRVKLVPFYASLGHTIEPFDFEEAASDKSLTADKIEVKGSSSERIDIFVEASASSEVAAKVPGGIQLEVIEDHGDWVHVKLLGGKTGYINRDNCD